MAFRSKYHNKKVEVDGIVFDSVKESRRWIELKTLEKIGKISGLERQKKFEIIPKTEDERAAHYVADFYYVENGVEVVEDVKSPYTAKDPVFRLKWKLMKWRYENIDCRIYL